MRRCLRTLALACALAAGVGSEAAAAGRGPDCNGARVLCQRYLDEVVLPGAHNAMSALDLGWRIPNQTLAIPDQLERGIRALLVDTHYGRLQADGTVRTDDNGQVSVGERGLYLCHVLCEIGASPLVPVLRSIRDFIAANRNTVIVIVNEDHVAPGDFAAAVEREWARRLRLRGRPGIGVADAAEDDRLARAGRGPGRARRRHGPLVSPRLRRHLARDAVLVPRPFAAHRPGQLAVELPSEPRRDDRVAVPAQPLVAGNAAGAAEPANSAAVNAENVILGRARECQRLRGRMPTIIAADQVTYGGLFDAVAELNGLAP